MSDDIINTLQTMGDLDVRMSLNNDDLDAGEEWVFHYAPAPEVRAGGEVFYSILDVAPLDIIKAVCGSRGMEDFDCSVNENAVFITGPRDGGWVQVRVCLQPFEDADEEEDCDCPGIPTAQVDKTAN